MKSIDEPTVALQAYRRLLTGVITNVVMLCFVSLPGVLYLLSYFLLPSGTATYITGPPSYLYFVVVIVTGFAFDAKLSALAGLVASIEYSIAFWLAREELQLISSPDPLLTQDLSLMPIYFFKSFILLFSGIFVGTIARTARRLLGRVLAEEREKSSIAGLFGQYVSAEVKDRIIAERSGVVGETREVVLLFCDIRGFTSFSEGQTPHELVQQLNEYFDAMCESIMRENGTIDKFIGDAVNTAARIEGLCPQYNEPLLISQSVYSQLSPENQARCVSMGPPVEVKGKRQAVEIFAVRDEQAPGIL